MPAFDRYIGIDYSGRDEPTSRIESLRVFLAELGSSPSEVRPPPGPKGQNRHWSRSELAEWIEARLAETGATIVGVDHAFSFPKSYMARHGLSTWDEFLRDFRQKWPTHQQSVESLRTGNERTGCREEFRLTECWTSSAKSVFLFDVNGSVAKSSHAGIPWLMYLRERLNSNVFFWPFDGFEVPEGRSVVAEVYPSIFRKRYTRAAEHTGDQHDAFAITSWLCERDQHGFLSKYFCPWLTDDERELASLEGWILGVA
jgi:hypothetical protein